MFQQLPYELTEGIFADVIRGNDVRYISRLMCLDKYSCARVRAVLGRFGVADLAMIAILKKYYYDNIIYDGDFTREVSNCAMLHRDENEIKNCSISVSFYRTNTTSQESFKYNNFYYLSVHFRMNKLYGTTRLIKVECSYADNITIDMMIKYQYSSNKKYNYISQLEDWLSIYGKQLLMLYIEKCCNKVQYY
jgi:hypothetical protein